MHIYLYICVLYIRPTPNLRVSGRAAKLGLHPRPVGAGARIIACLGKREEFIPLSPRTAGPSARDAAEIKPQRCGPGLKGT